MSNSIIEGKQPYLACRYALYWNDEPGGSNPSTNHWYVRDSTTGQCGFSMNQSFTTNQCPTKQACEQSALAGYTDLPCNASPVSWICTNRELNQCMPTTNVTTTNDKLVPFNYKVYKTYAECKAAPENRPCDSAWDPTLAYYINPNTKTCQSTPIAVNGFNQLPVYPSMGECETAKQSCSWNNGIKPTDHMFRCTKPAQIPLNAPGTIPALSTASIAPGLAGQGLNLIA